MFGMNFLGFGLGHGMTSNDSTTQYGGSRMTE